MTPTGWPSPSALAVAPVAPALNPAGPAQSDWLVHFCGRPPYLKESEHLPSEIAAMQPFQRLWRILQEERLRGFPPFGANEPMVCLSESPLHHLQWLMVQRGFPRWGLFVRRQWAYEVGGGPTWYARRDQYDALTLEQRRWATRLDTASAPRSDWLHEREWRIPVPHENGAALVLPRTEVVAVLVERPAWNNILAPGADGTPSVQQVPARWGDIAGIPHWWWNEATQTWAGV
jgi:hypothetical protein